MFQDCGIRTAFAHKNDCHNRSKLSRKKCILDIQTLLWSSNLRSSYIKKYFTQIIILCPTYNII